MSSQGLTPEQRKKIEENRQKALALRAKKLDGSLALAGSFAGQSSQHQTNSLTKRGLIKNDPKPNSGCQHNTTTTTITAQKPVNIGTSYSSSQPRLVVHPLPTQQTLHHGNNNSFSTNNNVQPASKQFNLQHYSGNHVRRNNNGREIRSTTAPVVTKDKFYGLPVKVINGKCVLISRDRFCVDVLYHGPLIEYFKQMETRSYDTSTKNWSFQVKEYDKFIKGVKNFQPDVGIEPLPPVVVQTFCQGVVDNDGIDEVDLSRIDACLVNTLMPFQKEGIFFALHHNGRILLADEMGLGKTLQALSIASYYRCEWPLLVVTPSSVRFDWAQQIHKWLPSVNPQEVNVVDSGKGNVKEGLVCVISYDLMPKKIVHLKERQFKVIIMDESHFLKNSKAIRTKAAAAISKLAKRIILLSGTPALSRPSELFTQITAVCPSMFKFHDFGVRYCAAKQQPWGWDYSGFSNLQELQLLLEKKIMIRRQKSDVLQQLPDKTRQVVILNPVLVSTSKDLSKASKIMDKASLKGVEKRGALLQYFHETCKAKLKAVKDFILDLIESDKKFLVFAHHQEMMDCIEDTILENTKIKHIRIDGSTKSEQRSLNCKKFQTHEDYRVAVLSITAANAGLNLSAANLVVFAELFWNPGILVQAEDRVHRIGQKNSVTVQYLMARKTADDFIWPLVQDKLTILTKAGLSKDCFSDADTTHVMDTSQRTIMDMFKHDFIEESIPLTVSESIQEEPERVSPSQEDPYPTTPTKAKRQRSLSQSPSSRFKLPSSSESPRSKQLRITQFLRASSSSPIKESNVTSPPGSSSTQNVVSLVVHDDQESHHHHHHHESSNQCRRRSMDQSTQTQAVAAAAAVVNVDVREDNNCCGDDFEEDLILIENEMCDESKSNASCSDDKKKREQPPKTKMSLSAEDCEVLNDMSWDDEEFWT